MFVENTSDIYKSIMEFNKSPEYWHRLLGSNPKYFIHGVVGQKHYFGLAKFCALKNISIKKYLTTIKGKFHGGQARNHMPNLLGLDYIEYDKLDVNTMQAFESWIHDFYPNYNIKNANFITIQPDLTVTIKKTKPISPDDLTKVLERQKRIGEIGEKIAYDFEIKRLKEMGIRSPNVKHESLRNASSGFDIYSKAGNAERFIEVKSSVNNENKFYLTENEMDTLSSLGQSAYLYLVKIIDEKKLLGNVHVISDPIEIIKNNGVLVPVLYQVKLDIDNF